MRNKTQTRPCASCRVVKPWEEFWTTTSRRCIECEAPTPCVICQRLCDSRYKTCRSPECKQAERRQNIQKNITIRRRKARERRKLTRRRCACCAALKPLTDYAPQKRDPETGEVIAYEYRCRPCKAAINRDMYRTHPERRDAIRQRWEEIKKRRATDPAFNERYLQRRAEYDRRYSERRRSRTKKTRQARGGGKVLDAQPFLEWVERQKARHEMPEENFCEAFGISARRLSDIRAGLQEHVQIDTVDEAVAREGSESLWDVYGKTLYPEEEAVAA